MKDTTHIRLRSTCLIVLTSLLATSCSTVETLQKRVEAQVAIAKRGGGEAEQQQFALDQQNTEMQPVAGGAVIGAVIGGMFGGRSGAMLGAGLGATAGHEAGQQKAQQKSGAQTQEATLDRNIESAKAENKQASKRVAQAKQKLADYKKEIAAAKATNSRLKLFALKRKVSAEANSLSRYSTSLQGTIDSGNRNLTAIGQDHSKHLSYRSELTALGKSKTEIDSVQRQYGSLMDSF